MDDKQWFMQHLKELRSKYESKLVAVLDGRIVAVSDDLEELVRIIEKKRGQVRSEVPLIQAE